MWRIGYSLASCRKRRWTRSDVWNHWRDPPEELHYGIFTLKPEHPPMFYHKAHYVNDREGKEAGPTIKGE